jgi:hypothetical protein
MVYVLEFAVQKEMSEGNHVHIIDYRSIEHILCKFSMETGLCTESICATLVYLHPLVFSDAQSLFSDFYCN